MWCWKILAFVNLIVCYPNIKSFYLEADFESVDYHGTPSFVVMLNGTMPGPEIRCTKGDIVHIRVKNLMRHDEFSLHFHGIDQKNTLKSDGVPYLTQKPIGHNEEYEYVFDTRDQQGTFFYHAHTKLHSSSAFGALIIEDDANSKSSLVSHNPEYQYDEEHVLMFSDHFTKTQTIMHDNLFKQNSEMEESVNGIFINGHSNCNFNEGPCHLYKTYGQPKTSFFVEQGKRYRLRLICSTVLSFLSFNIHEHQLTVVEADGSFVTPYNTNTIYMSSGQRYSVIIDTRNKNINSYAINVNVHFQEGKKFDYGMLRYKNDNRENNVNKMVYFRPTDTLNMYKRQEKKLKMSLWYSLQKQVTTISNPHLYKLPARVDKKLIIDVKEIVSSSGLGTRYYINQKLYDEPKSKPVYENKLVSWHADMYNQKKVQFDGLYQFFLNDTIDVIIISRAEEEGDCEPHPWHLHGIPFYVLQSGYGEYDYSQDEEANEYENPVLRDSTVVMPKSLESKPNNVCGWHRIRVLANNLGLWLLHCHVTQHSLLGMRVVIGVKNTPTQRPNRGYYSYRVGHDEL